MSDSDSSPKGDDRHNRRSRSRSPVSPGCTGETLPEREERRLAEVAVPVRPPASQPRAAPAEPRASGPGARAGRGGRPRRSGYGPCCPAPGEGPWHTRS